LSIANGGVTNPMLHFSSLTVTAGPGLSGGGAVSLGGSITLNLASASCAAGQAAVTLPLTCASFATLGANSFAGNQSVTGNLSATGEVSAGGSPSGNVSSGNVEVDSAAQNNGGYGPGLTFGGGGETIISNRAGITNQFGLDFFTSYTPRLSITNTGLVGIGVQSPGWMLEVLPPSDSRIFGGAIFGADDTGSGVGASYALYTAGGNDTTTIPFNSAGLAAFLVGGSSNIGFGGDGVDAYPGTGAAGNGYAGYFAGDVDINGTIYTGSKDFKIDHPLDPANKYMYHASVESSEMKNIYDGTVTTDANGDAAVELPQWFETLNRDFRYQLTVIGQFAQAIVASKIANHRFSIKTDKPNVEVCWQVTGVRQDAYAMAHPLQVEVDKPGRERGYYIHPQLYGAPEDKSIEWARHPELMKRMKELRAKQAKLAEAKKP
jgi:hypothetical protein